MKVIISGYGRMGHMVESVLERQSIECAGAYEDICSIDPELAAECVCIDFTTPDAFRSNYPFLAAHFKAVVVGTTGWNDIKDEVTACFREAGTPMVYSSNYSIGVNVFFAAVRRASELLRGYGYEPYIEEKHHVHKLDAPSGTARSLASLVEEASGVAPQVVSVRCGEIPGIHTVDFEGACDRLTFTHEAFSREGFAEGAVAAARLVGNIDGVVEFKDLILQ